MCIMFMLVVSWMTMFSMHCKRTNICNLSALSTTNECIFDSISYVPNRWLMKFRLTMRNNILKSDLAKIFDVLELSTCNNIDIDGSIVVHVKVHTTYNIALWITKKTTFFGDWNLLTTKQSFFLVFLVLVTSY